MKRTSIALLVLLAASAGHASAQLTYMLNGKPTPISWTPAAFPITWTLDQRAAGAMTPDSVARAFSDWTTVPNSVISFRSAGVSNAPGGKDGVNSVSLKAGLFANSGFIAYTTTWFDDDGNIQEADIEVDPTAVSNGDMETLVEHEVGHLLGLDHSAVLSSVMYPYIQDEAKTILDGDDAIAISTIYPARGFDGATATIRGNVLGSTGPLFGAQVVAVDGNGAPAATGLSDREGNFDIRVPAGTYSLYVEPLDGPVGPQNFSGVWRDGSDQGFRTEFLVDRKVTVSGGQVSDEIDLRGDGPATLNPRWIGIVSDGLREVKLNSTVASVRAGQTVTLAVGGDGIVGGLTQFEFLSPAVERVSDFGYGPNYIWATFRIKDGASPTSVVAVVKNGNDAAALTGALRITSEAPRRRAIR